MKIAIAGKGGSGKTTVAGGLTRLLARRGHRVLAIDGDTNPNLAQVLGLGDGDAVRIAALPNELLVRRVGSTGETRTELAVPAAEIAARYAAAAADGVRLMVMGRVDHAGAG